MQIPDLETGKSMDGEKLDKTHDGSNGMDVIFTYHEELIDLCRTYR